MNLPTVEHAGASILVVDDSSQNLKLLSKILTESGYTVRPANNGRTALESAQRQLPDLVLLDIRMPEMDGFETCRQFKADKRTQKIPIIFISGLEEVEDKVAAFNAGGIDYILKPFHPTEVLARVHTHLSLSKMQKQLEQMVGHRTAQLETSNRALRMLSV